MAAAYAVTTCETEVVMKAAVIALAADKFVQVVPYMETGKQKFDVISKV
jgi:hypothetical protein